MRSNTTTRSPFLISRRAVVQSGLRLTYAAPAVVATYQISPLRARAEDTVSIDIADELEEQAETQNSAPVAVVGDGIEVTDSDGDGVETVTVDGSASADPDGRIVSYTWTLGGEWVSSDAVATVTLPVGTHRLVLTVTDDAGAEDRAKLRIRVREGEPAADEPAEDAAPSEPTLPPSPYQVEVVQKFAEVAVTWKVADGTPVPFRIYRTVEDWSGRPVEELDWALIHEEWEKLSYRDAAVEPDVPYLYTVKSFDGVNESDFSNVVGITLLPAEPGEGDDVVEDVVESPTEIPDSPPVEEEVPVEEGPAEEAPVEEAPVEEVPVDEPQVDGESTTDEPSD
jgi:hypothetical protein